METERISHRICIIVRVIFWRFFSFFCGDGAAFNSALSPSLMPIKDNKNYTLEQGARISSARILKNALSGKDIRMISEGYFMVIFATARTMAKITGPIIYSSWFGCTIQHSKTRISTFKLRNTHTRSYTDKYFRTICFDNKLWSHRHICFVYFYRMNQKPTWKTFADNVHFHQINNILC